MFASFRGDALIDEIESSISQKFLINSFVREIYESDLSTFSFIVDISIGYLISTTILYDDFPKYQGSFKGKYLYLDAGILFSLIGTDGKEREVQYTELIKLLTDAGANIYVFSHTYDEFVGILEGCLNWIESANYDPFKANRALQFFKENNYTQSDVERYILGIDQKLAERKVETINAPNPNTNMEYQIDEKKLMDLIISKYKERIPNFDEEEKDQTLYLDVKSISAIYKLRQGSIPKTIKEAKHIFITTNSTLAYASRVYEIKEENPKDYFFIPSALTDLFIGTFNMDAISKY